MTLLEQIIKATTTTTSPDPTTTTTPSCYPPTFNSDPFIQTLKPSSQNPNPFSLIQPLSGPHLDPNLLPSQTQTHLYSTLKPLLTDPKLSSHHFLNTLNSLLTQLPNHQPSPNSTLSGADYTTHLLQKYGSLVGCDVMGLVVEGFLLFELWELVEVLIENRLVEYGARSVLLFNLVGRSRSDLICRCLRVWDDFTAADLVRVLRYLVRPTKEAVERMRPVKEEWESQAVSAIKCVSDGILNGSMLELAKDAAVLLMMAYDGFAWNELCLHFVVGLSVDEVVFASTVGKLGMEEVMGLVRYLGKWVRKYERFPQAVPCPKAEEVLGLEMCKLVPKLEDVVKFLGLVVDEHFSSMALHSEFHEEVKEIEGIVSSLVAEGRLCCSVANAIEVLKPEIGGA